MSGTLVAHCGGQPVGIEDLAIVPLPAETRTYTPIGHVELIQEIHNVGEEFLVPKGYRFVEERFAAAKNGARMFGVMIFQNGDDEIQYALGFRNSYDRSMSCGICAGGRVFVCDNLAFNGDISVMRKHTGDAAQALTSLLLGIVYQSRKQFGTLLSLAKILRATPVNYKTFAGLVGQLLDQKTINLTQFKLAMNQWREPSFEAFKEPSAWSAYNHLTYALKTAPVEDVLDAHVQVSRLFNAEFGQTPDVIAT